MAGAATSDNQDIKENSDLGVDDLELDSGAATSDEEDILENSDLVDDLELESGAATSNNVDIKENSDLGVDDLELEAGAATVEDQDTTENFFPTFKSLAMHQSRRGGRHMLAAITLVYVIDMQKRN